MMDLPQWDLHPYETKPSGEKMDHIGLHTLGSSNPQFFCYSKPPQTYECDTCNFTTDLKVIITNHMETSHNQEGPNDWKYTSLRSYWCENCNFQTFSLLVSMKHSYSCDLQIEVPKRPHKCEKCSFCFIQKSHLKNHELKVHGGSNNIKWFKCEQCPFQTRYKKHLRRHIMVKHSVLTPIVQCEYCTYKTKTKQCLKRHTKRKHVDPNEMKWKCELCPFRSEWKRTVEMHNERKHRPLAVTLRCSYCAYITNIKSDLDMHKRTHTDINGIKWFECIQCPYRCKWKSGMERHNKRKHTPLTVTLRCKYCSYNTNTKGDLEIHKQIHSEVKKIKQLECQQCSYKCQSKSDMERHNRKKHTPLDVPLQCEYCGYNTNTKGDLEVHKSTHVDASGVRWFKCQLCPFKCQYKSWMEKHNRGKHS